ncbi:MAG: polysaccharide biosynthesis protein [Clostridiales bacterium]|nr:polysaccharide biosynthesis protein [Clostridiales bacterium]
MKKLLNSFRNYILIGVFDILIVFCSMGMALLVRFDFSLQAVKDANYIPAFLSYFVIAAAVTLTVFIIMRMYQFVWHLVSLKDALRMLGAITLSCILGFAASLLHSVRLPISCYFINYVLCLISFVGLRYAVRILGLLKRRAMIGAVQNVMIVGGGDAGRLIIEELSRHPQLGFCVKCIIDDAPSKQKKRLNGIPIVGNRRSIPYNAKKYDIDLILVCMPAIELSEQRQILEICYKTNCKLKVLPGMYQFVNGKISLSNFRDVSVEDLLAREPIKVNNKEILENLRGMTVMVTGGGGSIGSELCRQIATHQPKALLLVDIYENNAYFVQQELKQKHPDLHLYVRIASVADAECMESLFKEFRPKIVFHAAAHKHVPLMEDSPHEAIKNNVFGTFTTATLAEKYGAEKFVLISTDKAVNPTNIMGASKRLCEMVIQCLIKSSQNTDFAIVRFGNVLGSNGSVIPLFKSQIEQGGPVTVTHPEVIRYFMTIPEAVSLILQAAAYAKSGEIFIFDMGKPVKIADLAKNLIRLSGYVPDVDIKIEYIGLRPGEKLYEELLMDGEGKKNTKNKMIYVAQPIEIDEAKFWRDLSALNTACRQHLPNIKQIVAGIVGTYRVNDDCVLKDEQKIE